MPNVKELLLRETADAFRGRPDMSLTASLADITQEEASWTPDANIPTIEQIVRHVAWAKSSYCQQGFGKMMPIVDESINADGDSPSLPWEFPCGAAWACDAAPGIEGAADLLQQSHRILTECLQSCTEESLEQPLPNRHGKSAANFFWIMVMHDLYHAGQIRTRRTLYLCGASRSTSGRKEDE